MYISHELFHTKYDIFHTLFHKFYLVLFLIFLIFHLFHMFAECFNNSTCFTIFTMFHNISQNTFRTCFVKYCTLISPKWRHCENSCLLQLCFLSTFPLLQCSLQPVYAIRGLISIPRCAIKT